MLDAIKLFIVNIYRLASNISLSDISIMATNIYNAIKTFATSNFVLSTGFFALVQNLSWANLMLSVQQLNFASIISLVKNFGPAISSFFSTISSFHTIYNKLSNLSLPSFTNPNNQNYAYFTALCCYAPVATSLFFAPSYVPYATAMSFGLYLGEKLFTEYQLVKAGKLTAETQRDKAETTLASKDQELKQVQKENSDLKAQLSEQLARANDFEAQHTEMSKQLKNAKNEKKALEGVKHTLEIENAHLKGQLLTHQGKSDDISSTASRDSITAPNTTSRLLYNPSPSKNMENRSFFVNKTVPTSPIRTAITR